MILEQIIKLAHEMPEKYIIKELENAMILYKEYNNEELKMKLLTCCMMLISSDMSKKNGVQKTITEMKNLKAMDDRLNCFKN